MKHPSYVSPISFQFVPSHPIAIPQQSDKRPGNINRALFVVKEDWEFVSNEISQNILECSHLSTTATYHQHSNPNKMKKDMTENENISFERSIVERWKEMEMNDNWNRKSKFPSGSLYFFVAPFLPYFSISSNTTIFYFFCIHSFILIQMGRIYGEATVIEGDDSHSSGLFSILSSFRRYILYASDPYPLILLCSLINFTFNTYVLDIGCSLPCRQCITLYRSIVSCGIEWGGEQEPKCEERVYTPTVYTII